MTYRQLSYAILSNIKKDFDDSSVSINQIIFWIQLVSNRILSQHINKSDIKGGYFLTPFYDVEVKNDDRIGKYIELPSSILDIINDGGLDTITYCKDGCEEEIHFIKTTFHSYRISSMNPNRRATPSEPRFYLINASIDGDGKTKKIAVLKGLDCIYIDCVNVYLYTNISSEFVCDLDSEIPVSNEMGNIVYYEVINILKLGFLINKDRKNDGSDSSETSKGVAYMNQNDQQGT